MSLIALLKEKLFPNKKDKRNPNLIQITMLDGTPHGNLKAEIDSWEGLAFAGPGDSINSLIGMQEFSGPGIYIFFDEDLEGVSMGIEENLRHAIIKKEKWDRKILITSKWGNTGIGFFEQTVALLAKEIIGTKRVQLDTDLNNVYGGFRGGVIYSEENFKEGIKRLLPFLGFDPWKTLPVRNEEPLEEQPKVLLPEKPPRSFPFKVLGVYQDISAEGLFDGKGVTILKGSQAVLEEKKGAPATVGKTRKKLIEEGIMKKAEDRYVFEKDYYFRSPSGACMAMIGRACGGWDFWKTEDGKRLREWKV